jgi:hypothetical protein
VSVLRRVGLLLGLVALFASGLLVAGVRHAPASVETTCPDGFVLAHLSWGDKCLHAGEFCKTGNPEYHQYGFDCPDGRLVETAKPPTINTTTTTGTTTTTAASTTRSTVVGVKVGRSVPLGRRSRTRGCTRGALPDRRCSPGAYYSGLTAATICSSGFRTSTIRNVPQSEMYAVEREYGLAPRAYGRTIEIDHIISLELGGSNDIGNLFPEPGSGRANYHVKDRLENRLHAMVCSGAMTLAAARSGIARNWKTLYAHVYGVAP